MPPLTIENAGALVEGGGASASKDRKDSNVQKPAAPTMVDFTVARAFYYQGKPLEVGKTYQLPRVFAVEMKSANKGTFVAVDPSPAQAAPVAKPQPKEDSNARK